MALLPNIQINGYELSIQDPYTLNGGIITDIECYYDMNMNQDYIIRNEYNIECRITYTEFKNAFQTEMNEFIRTHGYDTIVIGRREHDWRLYTFHRYIEEIRDQCSRINIGNYTASGSSYIERYIERLKTELQRQGRLTRENDIGGSYVLSSNSLNSDHISANRSSLSYLTLEGLTSSFNSYATFYNNSILNNKNKYIHSYNYKPEYIHHYMPGENQDTTLLLGAEIEVDCGGESEEHAKEVLKIICGVDSDDTNKVLENKMYCTHDGSLKAGIEFDTMPCSLEYHKNKMKYKEMFKYLDKNGYKAHDTTTCGLHIHADRKYLGKSKLVQQLTISKILYILEKFNDEICVIARRNNDYSRFVGKNEVNESLDKLYGKYYNTGKKVALNLQHNESIEFRCFKGTLKYETFILTLEFVQDIIDYAKSVNVEEIELIQWSDLMNTFSDGLKEYYNNRLEKENNKKQENKEAKPAEEYVVRYADWYGLIDSIPPISLENIDLATLGRIGTYTPIESQVSFSLSNWCNGQITNAIYNNSEKSTEEKLKDDIKSLKKKIKYSNNPMEKKKLEKELNALQKELKKEKKRIKLNNNTES